MEETWKNGLVLVGGEFISNLKSLKSGNVTFGDAGRSIVEEEQDGKARREYCLFKFPNQWLGNSGGER